MSVPTRPVSTLATRMRHEFDDAFTRPLTSDSKNRELLISIAVAGERFAVRISDITGIAKLRPIAPLPSALPGLLGITAARSVLVPAYDLAALIGLPAATNERGWILFARGETPVGLVFDQFGGQVEIDSTNFFENDGSSSSKHLRQMAAIGATRLAVINIPGLVQEVRRNAGFEDSAKE